MPETMIVLGIVLGIYLFISLVLAILLERHTDFDFTDLFMIGLLWPILIPAGFVVWLKREIKYRIYKKKGY